MSGDENRTQRRRAGDNGRSQSTGCGCAAPDLVGRPAAFGGLEGGRAAAAAGASGMSRYSGARPCRQAGRGWWARERAGGWAPSARPLE